MTAEEQPGGESLPVFPIPPAYTGKVAIATPFYNLQAFSTYIHSLVETTKALTALDIRWEFWPLHGDSYVQRARNTICGKFLDSDFSDLFFIDSDQDWDVAAVLRVLLAPFDIVGASYKMKNNWDAWTAVVKMNGSHPYGIQTGADSAFLEATLLPCGFMRIRRQALCKFRDAYPDLRYYDEGSEGNRGRQYVNFFECSTQGGIFYGEDATFCKRWLDIGGQLWVEPKATITHYGIGGWRGNLDQTLRDNLREGTDAH